MMNNILSVCVTTEGSFFHARVELKIPSTKTIIMSFSCCLFDICLQTWLQVKSNGKLLHN